MPVTVHGKTLWAPSTSSGTSSRRCTVPASRSSWTSSTTIPRRGTKPGPRSASEVSRTRSITSLTATARTTPITAAPVEALRRRQVKNFMVAVLTSIGTPMLLMGDEMRRTQRGNNNAYCQDNETSWLDWSLLDRHPDLHRFVRLLIAHRLRGLEMTRETSPESFE